MESWREKQLDQRAAALEAKHSIVTSLALEGLRTPRKYRRQTSGPAAVHRALMDEIRAEPVEAWKAEIQATRTQAIENKQCVNREIQNMVYLNLKNEASPVAQKANCLKELRMVTDSPLEGWREERSKTKAHQHGNKVIMQQELLASPGKLKNRGTPLQNKVKVLSQLRRERIPNWQESEREARLAVQLNKHELNCDILKYKKTLRSKDIGELKSELQREIRSATDSQIPGWKEAEMEANSEVLKHKVQVNAEILGKAGRGCLV